MKDLPNKIIILIEIEDRERTMRAQPVGIWCILRIYNSLESK